MSAVRIATEGRWTVEGYCGDTAVVGKDLWPDLSRGKKGEEKGIPLRWIGHTYTDTAPWKLPKKSKGRPTYRTPEELYVYNAGDCKTTLDAYYELWGEAEAEDIGIDLVQNDIAHQLFAVDMQRVGLPVDYSRLVGVETHVRQQLAEASADFIRIAGREINLNSPAQMREVLYGDWKLPITVETKDGPSTADPVLTELRGLSTLTPQAAAGLDALFRLREHGQTLKLYVKPFIRLYRDGWIHPSWGATNTVTGRYTSSPNIQNWTDLFKQIVVAPPGWRLVAADYAALEQRIMGALVGGDLYNFVNRPDATTDAEKFDPDIDCHSHIARLVFGERFLHPEQYLMDILDPEARGKEAYKKKKGMRNHTKSVVYARNYGSGGPTILKIVKKSNPKADKDEVDRVIQVYDRRFPELPQYRERMYRKVNDPACRELRSPLLRRRRKFPGRNPVPLTDASNYAIQSMAADIVNLRMLELAKRLPRGAAIIAQVHDSITVLCRDYDANGVRDLMDEVLPCRYDLGHGAMLFDAKAKIGHSWDEV